ncbi:AAA family ATPase [Selenomonas sp. AE3005]|uniref:AAA family ATPase n=1 Tax=Selenomonas sp. AE3005 TaxID=1485543 RepID=UPI00068DCA4F|nr:AAA family ATPase [Selenomonas sp. AE3005]
MIYYKAILRYTLKENSVLQRKDDGTDPDVANEWAEYVSKISSVAGLQVRDEAYNVFVYDADSGKMSIAIVSNNNGIKKSADLLAYINKKLSTMKQNLGMENVTLHELEEISQDEFANCTERGSFENFINTRYHRNVLQVLNIEEYSHNNNRGFYCYSEELCPAEQPTYRSCQEKMKKLIPDESLTDEIYRIYYKNNKKGFWGHPVHYHIHAESLTSAHRMINLLMQALYKNGRISSFRKNIIDHIGKRCNDDKTIHKICKDSNGGVILFFLNGQAEDSGQYANANHVLVDFFEQLIRKNQQNILFMLVDIGQQATLSKKVIEQLVPDVSFVPIREGVGTVEDAMNFAQELQKERKFPAWDRKAFRKTLKKDMYRMSEVQTAYNEYCKKTLSEKIYCAYKTADVIKINSQLKSRSSAYEELNRLVGLDNVKSLINSILASSKMQKQRKKAGLPSGGNIPHLVFFGNPGSAKTTVARLLARILSDEQILQGDIFVECGRNDLVGQYVGWTAKIVEKKFREAKGGILFIDEAYSLVDDRGGSFGDEAINTIVQQMENHRDDTIVIFAGYPDKMMKFLKKNEGLRSRIGFQLTFNDYTPNQLDEILLRMAEERCYVLNDDARAVCHQIFRQAVRMKDFGNGRYARNLLQKAILNQADRIYAESANGVINKEMMMTLTAADFEDIDETFVDYDLNRDKVIGFVYN